MQRFIIFCLSVCCLAACKQGQLTEKSTSDNSPVTFIDSTDMTNNFYDNVETFALPVKELVVEGEIANPGKVDFSILAKRSVIVKETLLHSDGGDRFTGAYRYDGYSLFDILDNRILKKANSDEFNPVIDLFIEVENDTGEKVVFSWGEIYYPDNLHRIIIASDVARIIPSKTNDLWELPETSKIVAATDLITERNIKNPVRITVRSIPKSFKVDRDISPLYSKKIDLYKENKIIGELTSLPGSIKMESFNTIFYGRGRGIHSTEPFIGPMLKDILSKYFPVTRESLKTGIICMAAADGYRCALSYSELFNRNDQQEFLLIKYKEGEDGGLFRLFAAGDFFSDRAIKSVTEIHLDH